VGRRRPRRRGTGEDAGAPLRTRYGPGAATLMVTIAVELPEGFVSV